MKNPFSAQSYARAERVGSPVPSRRLLVGDQIRKGLANLAGSCAHPNYRIGPGTSLIFFSVAFSTAVRL